MKTELLNSVEMGNSELLAFSLYFQTSFGGTINISTSTPFIGNEKHYTIQSTACEHRGIHQSKCKIYNTSECSDKYI